MTTQASSSAGQKTLDGSIGERSILRFAAFGMLGILAIALSISKIADDDVFWHLATGRWILGHRAIPHQDVFGFVTQGQPWIPFEWGWDVVVYLSYSFTNSYVGVQLLCALTWLSVCALQVITMNRMKISTPVILFVVTLTLFTSLGRMTPRPQLVTTLGLAILSAISYGTTFSRTPRIIFALPLLFLIWANMHPGVLAGILFLLLYLVSAVALFFTTRPAGKSQTGSVWNNTGFRSLSLVVVLCCLAVLLNPRGWNTFFYTFAHTKMSFLSAIEEWSPPFTIDTSDRTLWFYKAYLLAGAASLWYSWKKRDPMPALCYIGFGLYSLQAVRFIADFAVVAAPGTALGLQFLLSRLRKPYNLLGGRVATALCILPLLYALWLIPDGTLSRKLRYHVVFGFGIDQDLFSQPMINFLRANMIEGRPFNQFDVGGELIWELPAAKNFIDSRNLNDRISDEYLSILGMKPGFGQKLDGYGIDHIIVHLTDLRESPTSMSGTLVPYCAQHPDVWKLVYWDDQSLVYVRNIPKFKDAIDRYEYRSLNPYLFVFRPEQFDSIRRAQPKVFESELQRKLRDEPNGFILNFIARAVQNELKANPQ